MMKERISKSFVLKFYPVLGIVLLSSLLRIPAILASSVFLLGSNRASLNSTTNWILYFLNECHSDTGSPLIAAGNLSDKIIAKVHHSAKRTIVLFTKPETSVDQTYARAVWTKDFYEKGLFPFTYKARIFLVAAKSQPILGHLLKQLKTSRWWNFSGLFFVLDEEPENSSCRNARSYLSTAWLNGLLSTVYLCMNNDTGSLTLYSYNPFDDKAPRPDWKTVAIYGTGTKNGHLWTLLRREFDSGVPEVGSRVSNFWGKLNCGEIFFDKMRNLNGYPVRISAVNFPPTLVFITGENISGVKKYSGEDGWLAQTLWKWLNATTVEVPQIGNGGIGFTDDDGIDYGPKADVRNGRVDISLNHRYMAMTMYLGSSTYPHASSDYCFLTKSRGVFSLWVNLTKSINPSVGFVILGIVIAVIPLLVNLEGSEYTATTFDVMRMLVSAPLVKIPRRFSARLLIAGFLGVVVIANGIFQSQIAVAVTKPRTNKDMDTLDDLEKSGYEIRGHIAFQNSISRPELRRRFVTSKIDDEECFEMAMKGLPVACASGCMMLSANSVKENELHVAKEPILTDHLHYITRIGWPILGRVNRLIKRMVSAGLPGYWRKQTLWQMEIESLSVSRTASSSAPRPIRINDLDAVFYLLLGGQLLSTLIFTAEVAFFRWRNKRS